MTANEVVAALAKLDKTALMFVAVNAEMVPVTRVIFNTMMAVFVPDEDRVVEVVEAAIKGAIEQNKAMDR
jgi:hypothetical protein